MNAKETARLAMYVVTADLETTADPAIIAGMPKFNTHLTEFKLAIADIDVAARQQQDYPRLTAADKTAAREALLNSMLNAELIVKAFAADNNKPGIAQGVIAADSTLRKLNDKEFSLEAENIVKLITEWENDLAPYGIGKNEILELSAATDLFKALMSTPRLNVVAKADATKKVKEGFRRADEALLHMDNLVKTRRKSQPDFHNDYWQRRIIVNLPSQPLALRGTVVNAAGVPLKGVKMTIDGHTQKARTTAKGTFRVKSLPDGVYVLRFVLPGYEELLHTIAITNGNRNFATIQLREQ
ncbi:MAG: hypothetical protein CFE23_10790 [Flavobacterium sp. BFFFF1]|uniref:carboxypeptidase-like regulatory domain-containing protein n=1 Tax=Flavobacterium sp. BFFFF1 TaxID=2015557 RepID=UPI000BC5BE85|nr:carboxypeptidase-like regulatory domain-containing protein [Flavobacterium sp. BFFFF1]OYU80195.1 MAG: hypothetical protein CFE23_10790 [Flavobacterium sp. BFFFF1]